MKTKYVKTIGTLAPGEIGQIEAVFSVFNMVDSDGDVVLPSAFKDGQEVPMVWSHDWTKPIGKGVIRVEPDRAVFSGSFFMDTAAGGDAYRTVKAMGDLQEYSWGFQVKEAERGNFGGQSVRFIRASEVFEVSPTLVGANRQTHTLAIKSDDAKYMGMGGEPPEGSYEALSEDLEEAFRVASVPDGTDGWTYVVATFSDHFVACLCLMGQDDTYWDVPFVMGPDGETPQLGTPTEVEIETTFSPVKGVGLSYGLHAARVESAVEEFGKRTRAGMALGAKEGRQIREARRVQLATIRDGLRSQADELHAIYEETAPPAPAPEKAADVDQAFAALLAIEARLCGVAV